LKRKRLVAAAAATVLAAGLLATFSSSAEAVDPPQDTGASATKVCAPAVAPDFYTIGETIPCTALFANTGLTPATVTNMTDIAPFISLVSPDNGPPIDIECALVSDPATIIGEGDTLAPNQICRADFLASIPNDVAFCNRSFRDLASITLEYPQFDPPLQAFAGASATTTVVCPPSITVTKTASPLSKVTDPVDYTITVCNTGLVPVTKVSVTDPLIADVNAAFGPGLAPGQCEAEGFQRTVLPGDPDPLINVVTAVYNAGAQSATASATAETNLFQPSVSVTKSCSPKPNEAGGISTCVITVSNTSSGDSPALVNGTIVDTLTGNLLDATNTAIFNSDCTPTLAVGANCTITTRDVIEASDPNPVVNTVTVHYNPFGFPNDITDEASDSVPTVSPSITVVKTADALGKVTDPVDYTITICNTGTFPVSRTSVSDSLQGDIAGLFGPTLASGACETQGYSRVVQAGDADPLVNTVTAVYSGAGASATASDSAETNLFQPSVGVTKECGPDPISVGAVESCVINVTDTSSADSPALTNGTISDTLSGDLLLAGNTAVVASTCTGTLPEGGTCQITTNRTVLASDVSPIVNTVTVNYNPTGFPNNITASASDSVVIQVLGTGCTPGFWKQPGHFDSWVGYTPNQLFDTVFGVTFTNKTLLESLKANGGGNNAFLRFAVSALLNASSTTSPDFTTAQVIAIVQSAVNPGGLTIAEATAMFTSAPGVVVDNCDLIRP
jgi:uncharacterized repeat protein (TIGR01451 family)